MAEEREETKGERLDRELIELLNGLRVILPGVQVLFAFLLTVPFTQRFDSVTGTERNLFFAAFLCAAVAAVLLMAPSAYHRLRWRQRDKERLLATSNRLAIAGTLFLAASMSCAVFVVTDLLFGSRVADLAAGVIAAAFGWFWYGLPLARAARDRKAEPR